MCFFSGVVMDDGKWLAIAMICFFFGAAISGFAFKEELIEDSCYKNHSFYIGNQQFICMEAK